VSFWHFLKFLFINFLKIGRTQATTKYNSSLKKTKNNPVNR